MNSPQKNYETKDTMTVSDTTQTKTPAMTATDSAYRNALIDKAEREAGTEAGERQDEEKHI